MFWIWQAGHKALRVDLKTDALEVAPKPATGGGAGGMNMGDADTFLVHLGSTSCASPAASIAPADPCSEPNRPTITLPGFDPGVDVVQADLARLLAGSDVRTNQPGTSPGCMSDVNDDDCIPVMARFGLPFRGVPSPGQSFFRAVSSADTASTQTGSE